MYFILSASAFVCRYEYQNRKIITHCTQPALILALIAFLCPQAVVTFSQLIRLLLTFYGHPHEKLSFEGPERESKENSSMSHVIFSSKSLLPLQNYWRSSVYSKISCCKKLYRIETNQFKSTDCFLYDTISVLKGIFHKHY